MKAKAKKPSSDLPANPRDTLRSRLRNRKILKRVLGVVLGLDIMLGGLIIYLLFLHVPYFNLQHVDVTGARRLSKDEVVEISEVCSGVNLLTVDLNQIALKLRRHPWIRSASVYRRFPGQMIIEIDERTPRAILASGKLFYADDQGELFTRVLPDDSVDYPLFTGISPEDLKERPAEVQELVRTGFNLLDLIERAASDVDPAEVSEVRLNLDEGLSVLTSYGKLIVFGKEDHETKLFRLGRLKRFLTQRGEWNNAHIINLDFEDRALVRSDKSRVQG